MAARTTLKRCVLAAIENFHHHNFPYLAIVHHTRGKYYSLMQPCEFDALPNIQDPDHTYIVFLGTKKELLTFCNLQSNQVEFFDANSVEGSTPS